LFFCVCSTTNEARILLNIAHISHCYHKN